MKTKILLTLFALMISGAIAFGQDTLKTEKKQTTKHLPEMQKDSVYYTCTMHPDVRLANAGKCPECGMDLVKKTVKNEAKGNKSDALTSYVCPMHPEETSEKPGKCPKCGMAMVAKK